MLKLRERLIHIPGGLALDREPQMPPLRKLDSGLPNVAPVSVLARWRAIFEGEFAVEAEIEHPGI